VSDFGSLREDVPAYVGPILKALESQRDLNEAWTRLFEAYSDEIASLWKDNAALRDELHAVANRVESLTRARLTEPAEVAEAMVQPYPVCVCGHRYDHHDGTAGCHHKMTCGCLDYEPRGIVRERQR